MAHLDLLNLPLAEMPERLELPPPPANPFDVAVRPPGSKSLTNRALLLAALTDGVSTIGSGLLDADDAKQMRVALESLGARIEVLPHALRIHGVGGKWRTPFEGITLNLNNAGTAARFLAGSALLSPSPMTIDGNTRMRARPIGELVDLLVQLGCSCQWNGTPGCPPLQITPPPTGFVRPAVLEIGPTQSSQFVSALLLVAPWLKGGLTIRLTSDITSSSYIAMTAGLLSRLGAGVQTSDHLRVIRVRADWQSEETPSDHPAGLRPFHYNVEPDASGATYFWSAAAISPGSHLLIEGLDEDSLQGDARYPQTLIRMGAIGSQTSDSMPGIGISGGSSLQPILADMADMPDAAMTLAVTACFAPGTSILRGVSTLRVKECDRIDAMQRELAKIGVRVDSPVAGDHEVMTITPPPQGIDCSAGAPTVEFDTYDDHRIAMSLSLLALRRPNVVIRHPQCVAKTYPTFWRDLGRLFASGASPRPT